MMMTKRLALPATAILISILPTACGGGGGGPAPAPIPALRILQFGSDPATTQVGQTLATVTVRLLTDGAVETAATAPVTVTLAGGTGTLSGTTTATPIDGIATFADLSIDVPSNGYFLQAVAGEFGTAVTGVFTITAAPVIPPPVVDTVTAPATARVREQATLDCTASGDFDQITLEPGGVDLTGTLSAMVTPFPRAAGKTIGVGTSRNFKVVATRGGDPREYLDVANLFGVGDVGAVVQVTDLVLAANGGFVAVGNFEGTVGFGVGQPGGATLTASGIDSFVIAFEANSAVRWVRQFGGTGSVDTRGIAINAIGEYIVAGNTGGAAISLDGGTNPNGSLPANTPFVAAYTETGALTGTTAISTPSSSTITRSVAATYDGGFAVGGQFEQGSPDLRIWFRNDSGGLIGQTDFRGLGDNICNHVASASGQGVAFIGDFGLDLELYENNMPVLGSVRLAAGGKDAYIGVFDENRKLRWNAQIGGAGDDRGLGVDLLPDGSVFVTGSFVGTATARGGSVEQVLNASGGASDADVFVAKFDRDGVLQWARSAGGSAQPGGGANGDQGQNVTALPDGSCLVAGFFTGTATFGEGAREQAIAAAGGADDADAFVARYLANGDLAYVTRLGSPNGADQGSVAVGDAAGRVLWSGSIGANADVDTVDGPTQLVAAGDRDTFFVDMTPRNYRYANTAPTGYDSGTRWSDSSGATNDRDRALGIAAMPDGGTVVCGWFTGTIVFNKGTAEEIVLASSGERDAFYLRRAADGEVLWARKIGSSGYEIAMSCDVSADGFIAIGGIFEGGLPAVSRGNADVFCIEVKPEDGELRRGLATGGAADDGGVSTSFIFTDLDDGAVDVCYMPGSRGSQRKLWLATTVNREASEIRTFKFEPGGSGVDRLIAPQSALGRAVWVQEWLPGNSTSFPPDAYFGSTTNQGARGRTISVSRDGDVYVGGVFVRDFPLTFEGYNSALTIPSQSGTSFDGFVVKFRAGTSPDYYLITTTGDDRINTSTLLPNGLLVVGGEAGSPTSRRGIVAWLDPNSLTAVGGNPFFSGEGPVLGVASLGGDRVAAVGYELFGANPFNGSSPIADTAYLSVMSPTSLSPARFFGGLGEDRAQAVTTLIDGSVAVCGYVHDGGVSSIPGYNPVCQFAFGEPNSEFFNEFPGAGLLADPFWARFVLPE